MTSLEVSNPGFKWNWDENKLVGKLFGGIFGEEEYEKQDGSIGTTVKCRFVRSVDAIREGEFKTPEKKLLNPANTGWKQVEDDDELPF